MIEISNVSMVFENAGQPVFQRKNHAPAVDNSNVMPMMPMAGNIGAPPMVGASPEKIFSDEAPAVSGAGRKKALDNVSLVIPDGCIYGFLGSNGAGKSTLMRMISGVYKTDQGSIKIDGQEVYDNSDAKDNIFFVNDETIEYTNFTLETLMRYYRNYYPRTFNTDVFQRLAAVLGLPMNKPLSAFSKGMKRQSVVIIGLASYTKYLMLDEAFDGLDPAMRAMVKDIILGEIRGRNATLIISSHNLHEIGELCDRAMLIDKGKLIFADELDKIKGRFVKYQLVCLDRVISPEEISAAGIGVMQYKAEGKVVRIIFRGDENTEKKIGGLNADLAEQIPLTLEEIFIYEMNTYNNRI